MLNKLKNLLFKQNQKIVSLLKDKNEKNVNEDLIISIIVLLIEMSSQDQDVAKEEADEIVDIINKNYFLEVESIPSMIAIALEERKKHAKIDHFVAIINNCYNQEQKTLLLALIWKLVNADGRVDDFEKKFAVQLKYRFKLNDEEEARAKRLVDQNQI